VVVLSKEPDGMFDMASDVVVAFATTTSANDEVDDALMPEVKLR
jgi:hypothetical protein